MLFLSVGLVYKVVDNAPPSKETVVSRRETDLASITALNLMDSTILFK